MTAPNGTVPWIAIGIVTTVLLTVLGGVWSVMQSQLKAGRVHVDDQVQRIDEHLGLIRDQLILIEQTRPTTGELQAIAETTAGQRSSQEERIRAIENYLLGQRRVDAPTE